MRDWPDPRFDGSVGKPSLIVAAILVAAGGIASIAGIAQWLGF